METKRSLRRQGTIPVLPGWKEKDPQPTSTYHGRSLVDLDDGDPLHHQEARPKAVIAAKPENVGGAYTPAASPPWLLPERPGPASRIYSKRASKVEPAPVLDEREALAKEYAKAEADQKRMGGVWSPGMEKLEERKAEIKAQLAKLGGN